MEEALAVHTQEEEEECNETLNPQTLETQSLRKREAFFAQKGVLCRFFHENRLIFENVQTPGTSNFILICKFSPNGHNFFLNKIKMAKLIQRIFVETSCVCPPIHAWYIYYNKPPL